MISKVRYHPKFNLGHLNAYKLMFAIKILMEKRTIFFWIAGFFLPMINATVFSPHRITVMEFEHTRLCPWKERRSHPWNKMSFTSVYVWHFQIQIQIYNWGFKHCLKPIKLQRWTLLMDHGQPKRGRHINFSNQS